MQLTLFLVNPNSFNAYHIVDIPTMTPCCCASCFCSSSRYRSGFRSSKAIRNCDIKSRCDWPISNQQSKAYLKLFRIHNSFSFSLPSTAGWYDFSPASPQLEDPLDGSLGHVEDMRYLVNFEAEGISQVYDAFT